VVVIDCPPALGLLTVNALVRHAPADPDSVVVLRLEGTDDLLETIEKVRSAANPTLRILGVVITMHDKRTALARDIRRRSTRFRQEGLQTVITKSVRLEESPPTRNRFSSSRRSRRRDRVLTGSARRSSIVSKTGFHHSEDAPRRALRRGAASSAGTHRAHVPIELSTQPDQPRRSWATCRS
jgi:cellulose biosynthesis protein BcsQ